MNRKIFSDYAIEIYERNERFFIRYDAGNFVGIMREDEITEEEAKFAVNGPESADKILLALQKRLIEAGIDPYRSNMRAT